MNRALTSRPADEAMLDDWRETYRQIKEAEAEAPPDRVDDILSALVVASGCAILVGLGLML